MRQLAQLPIDDAGPKADVQQQLAQDTHDLRLNRPVPVLLHYSTVELGAGGEPQFRDDICARDPALLAALDRDS